MKYRIHRTQVGDKEKVVGNAIAKPALAKLISTSTYLAADKFSQDTGIPIAKVVEDAIKTYVANAKVNLNLTENLRRSSFQDGPYTAYD